MNNKKFVIITLICFLMVVLLSIYIFNTAINKFDTNVPHNRGGNVEDFKEINPSVELSCRFNNIKFVF